MSETTIESGDDEAAEFDELLTRIPEMDQQLSDLQGAVEGLLEELANYPAGGPWLWEGLDPAAQRELWVELDAFVTWLQNRILCHHMAKEGWIAPCWYRHPDAVEQLTALMVAHKASYHPKSEKPSHALVDWFQRCLWPTMDTLKQRTTFKKCLSKGEHDDPYMPGVNLVANTDAFTAFVDATVPGPVEPETQGPADSSPRGEIPPRPVDPATGEVLGPPAADELPEPEEEGGHHG